MENELDTGTVVALINALSKKIAQVEAQSVAESVQELADCTISESGTAIVITTIEG